MNSRARCARNFYSRSNESSSVFLSPVYYRVTIGDVREMQLVEKRAREQTLTQSPRLLLAFARSRLSDDRANRRGENESSSIAVIDNGHMSGYGIGPLYRRIRGRLSCQSAYRAALIILGSEVTILSHVTRRRVRQSAFSTRGLCPPLCLHVTLRSPPNPVPFHYLSPPLSLAPLPALFFSLSLSPTRELKISNLPNADTCNIDRTSLDCLRHRLHVQAARFVQIRNFQYPSALLQFGETHSNEIAIK